MNKTTMQKRVGIIGAALVIGLATLGAYAQTSPPPATVAPAAPPPAPAPTAIVTGQSVSNSIAPATFFVTAENYFTSFNHDLAGTFAKPKQIEVISGVDTYDSKMSAALSLDYQLWNHLGIRATGRGATVGAALSNAGAGISYHRVVVDVDISVYAQGGWDFDRKQARGELGVQFLKALTENTFAGISLYVPIEKGVGTSPGFSVLTGFTF